MSNTPPATPPADRPAPGIRAAFLSPRGYLIQLRDDRRQYGWKGLIKRHGWRPFALFFLFYLVRDVILYVLIPLGIYLGFSR